MGGGEGGVLMQKDVSGLRFLSLYCKCVADDFGLARCQD